MKKYYQDDKTSVLFMLMQPRIAHRLEFKKDRAPASLLIYL